MYANALSAAQSLEPCFEEDGTDLLQAYRGDPYACPGYRFPTEAEWEFAARGDEDTTYSGGDTVADVAWYSGNSTSSREACTRQPNAWGICDMSGDVWEWTVDWYAGDAGGYADGAPSEDPAGAEAGSRRVMRGGCWSEDETYTRLPVRFSGEPDTRSISLGFRLATSSVP